MHNKPTGCSWSRLLVLAATLFLAACAEGPMTRPDIPGSKWVGPLVKVPGGGEFRTVIFYGPWQCSRQLMTYCERKCAGSGHILQGCMWLADVKMDFQGTLIQTGSRFGVTHCCCNYSALSPTQNRSARNQWDNVRSDFRDAWAERFGAWPRESNGDYFQGHHIRDLGHGGNPTDWDNLIPYPRHLHKDLNALYAQCYAKSPPWTSVGVDYPYGE